MKKLFVVLVVFTFVAGVYAQQATLPGSSSPWFPPDPYPNGCGWACTNNMPTIIQWIMSWF